MSEIHEADRALSLVIAPDAYEGFRAFAAEHWCLTDRLSYLNLPERADRAIEVVRGLSRECGDYVVEDLRIKGIEGSLMRWDEVDPDVLRAPQRLPGYVGERFSFAISRGKVFDWWVPVGDEGEVSWQDQGFSNHDHPSVGADVPEGLIDQRDYYEALQKDLAMLFPERRFIVEYVPGNLVTFYEPDDDAPTESETEWEDLYNVPKHPMMESLIEKMREKKPDLKFVDYTSGTCHRCGGMKVAEAEESKEFPGVILASCTGCDAQHLAKSRVLRFKVGAW